MVSKLLKAGFQHLFALVLNFLAPRGNARLSLWRFSAVQADSQPVRWKDEEDVACQTL